MLRTRPRPLRSTWQYPSKPMSLLWCFSAISTSSRIAITLVVGGEMNNPSTSLVSSSSRTHGRVLVVDDDQLLVRALVRTLSAAGYEVAAAADGRRAAELISATEFDVIVSDLDMPLMNGIQPLQTVRQRDLDVPVVLMTGNPDLKTAVQAVAHGALQYLIKPVNIEELGKVIRRAVRLNRMAKLKREALGLV